MVDYASSVPLSEQFVSDLLVAVIPSIKRMLKTLSSTIISNQNGGRWFLESAHRRSCLDEILSFLERHGIYVDCTTYIRHIQQMWNLDKSDITLRLNNRNVGDCAIERRADDECKLESAASKRLCEMKTVGANQHGRPYIIDNLQTQNEGKYEEKNVLYHYILMHKPPSFFLEHWEGFIISLSSDIVQSLDWLDCKEECAQLFASTNSDISARNSVASEILDKFQHIIELMFYISFVENCRSDNHHG